METATSNRRVLAILLLCGGSLAGCYVPPAEGRFPCQRASQCPADWYCRADLLCWSTPGDAEVGDDGGVLPDAQVEAGSDAGVDSSVTTDAWRADAGPPECSSDGECPAIVSHCVAGRCTFCAPASPAVIDVHADPGLADEVELVVAQDGDAREIVVAWRGAGTRLYLHRTPLAAPVAPVSPSSQTDAILSIEGSPVTGVTEILDVALGAFGYTAADGEVNVAFLARRGTLGTVLIAALYQSDLAMPIGSSYPGPEYRMAPDAHLGRIAMDEPTRLPDGRGSLIVRSRVGATLNAEVYGLDYLDFHDLAADARGFPAETVAIESAQHFVLMADPADTGQVFVWEPGQHDFFPVGTADRSGEPTWSPLGTRLFLLAYPASTEIHLRAMDCTALCTLSTSRRADVRTGSDEVQWVRVVSIDGAPALLSSERRGSRWLLLLRVLRDDLRVLTAPGGDSALVLDESGTPDFAAIGRIEEGNDLDGTRRIVASWVNHPATGDRIVRLTSMPLACE